MTLSCVWLRSVGSVQEMVFATDSRLRGPFVWDACPKIMPLARNDSALCFAGDTGIAYPIMLQVQTAIRQHSRTLNRAVDLPDFKGKVIEIINGMRDSMHSLPHLEDGRHIEDETFLLLGGYSWRDAAFAIWTLHFDPPINRFTFRPASPWGGVDSLRLLSVVGNEVEEAKARLIELLKSRGKRTSGGFDMEPFEILRDMIRQDVSRFIGGPPQLLKVYRHMNATPLSVYWPSKAAAGVTMLGRRLLPYERSSVGILDPDTLEINAPAA